jgi:hypothetical protein
MPIKGARYRVKQTKKGPVRLAFKGDKVVEAKNMKTGDAHMMTPEEMQPDMKKRGMMKRMGK